mgnify:CR=1 FL=1
MVVGVLSAHGLVDSASVQGISKGYGKGQVGPLMEGFRFGLDLGRRDVGASVVGLGCSLGVNFVILFHGGFFTSGGHTRS